LVKEFQRLFVFDHSQRVVDLRGAQAANGLGNSEMRRR